MIMIFQSWAILENHTREKMSPVALRSPAYWKLPWSASAAVQWCSPRWRRWARDGCSLDLQGQSAPGHHPWWAKKVGVLGVSHVWTISGRHSCCCKSLPSNFLDKFSKWSLPFQIFLLLYTLNQEKLGKNRKGCVCARVQQDPSRIFSSLPLTPPTGSCCPVSRPPSSRKPSQSGGVVGWCWNGRVRPSQPQCRKGSPNWPAPGVAATSRNHLLDLEKTGVWWCMMDFWLAKFERRISSWSLEFGKTCVPRSKRQDNPPPFIG